MDLFDFYKLLNLPVGTPIADVKKAYMLKVHQYSGAFQDGDERAAEYLKIISSGYAMLSDPEKKRVYDLMLLRIYVKQKGSDMNRSLYNKYGNSERNPLKGEAEEGDQILPAPVVKELTEDQKKVAQIGVQREKTKLGISMLLLCLLYFVFNFTYWQPYTDIKMVSFVFLGVMYMILMLWTSFKVYRYFEIRNLIYQKISSEKWVIICFFIMIFALPVTVIKFESIKKKYHLMHYASRTKPVDFMIEDNWLTVSYMVDGKEFKQSISLGDKPEDFKEKHYDRSNLVVKYSTHNPKIIEIETIK